MTEASISGKKPCPKCGGSGRDYSEGYEQRDTDECAACGGTGYLADSGITHCTWDDDDEPGDVLEVAGRTYVDLDVAAHWLRHIDRLGEIPGAGAAMPDFNPLWDASFAMEQRFRPGGKP